MPKICDRCKNNGMPAPGCPKCRRLPKKHKNKKDHPWRKRVYTGMRD